MRRGARVNGCGGRSVDRGGGVSGELGFAEDRTYIRMLRGFDERVRRRMPSS